MILNSIRHLTEAEHLLVTDAVAAAENETDAEIVTIVSDLSDHYADVALAWATAIAFLALSVVAFMPKFYQDLLGTLSGGWAHPWTPSEYLALIFIFMGLKWLATWLILKWMPLRIALTPKHIKAARVRARAIDLFKVGTEVRTRRRTGILIYLSLREHRAEIVADRTIAEKVSSEVWGDAMLALIAKVKVGEIGAGMADAVRIVGQVAAEHFPRSADDSNELPDRLIEL